MSKTPDIGPKLLDSHLCEIKGPSFAESPTKDNNFKLQSDISSIVWELFLFQ